MIKKIKPVILALFMTFLFVMVQTTPVHADDISDWNLNTKDDDDAGAITNTTNTSFTCSAYATEEERERCMRDRTGSVKTADFITKGILSFNEEIAKLEYNQDYIKNFSNSSMTALSYDLWLADPDTIIMHLVNVIITFIEMIGLLISLVVLLLYNVASSSFWKTILTAVLNLLDSSIFDFGNPNSLFMKILILFGVIAVIKGVFSRFNRIRGFKSLIEIIMQTVLSCMLIYFIAANGRPIMDYVENVATSSIVYNFNFLENQYDTNLPLEINVKNQMFDILQKQGFVLRHFGVTSASQISNINSGDYKSSDKGKEIGVSGEERVQTLLDNPSKDNSQIERQQYGSTMIPYSSSRCFAVLGLSVIFFVHRILMAILLGASSIVLLIVELVKDITLYTSVYGLLLMLFNKEKRIAAYWFVGRLKWLVVFILSNLIFNVLISFIILFINGISSADGARSLLIMLPFDAILAYGSFYVLKNFPDIWTKVTGKFGLEGQSAFEIGKGIIKGEITPDTLINNYKSNNASGKSNGSTSSASDDISNEDSEDSAVTDDPKDEGLEDTEEDMNHNDDDDENIMDADYKEIEEENDLDDETDIEQSLDLDELDDEEEIEELDQENQEDSLSQEQNMDMEDVVTNNEEDNDSVKMDETEKAEMDEFMDDILNEDEVDEAD